MFLFEFDYRPLLAKQVLDAYLTHVASARCARIYVAFELESYKLLIKFAAFALGGLCFASVSLRAPLFIVSTGTCFDYKKG
jgi:hypothetical protein